MFSHRTPILTIVFFGVWPIAASGVFVSGPARSSVGAEFATNPSIVRDLSRPSGPTDSGMCDAPAGSLDPACVDLADHRFFVAQPKPPRELFPKTSRTIPAFPVSTSHADWPSYLKYATLAASGKNNFGYSILDVAQVWAIKGRTNNSMRDWCVAEFRKRLAAALDRWNENQNVLTFSADSYLYCGDQVSQWVIVLNWFGGQLTEQEKSDAAMILEQTIWNIWHPTEAKWGTKVYRWTGWATGNPWNNYFYRSHWKATLWWAIHSQSQTWLAKLKDYCIPLLKERYAKLVDGGSLEGTGYGSAYWQLFQDIWLTREALGIDLTNDCRVPEHIEYWVQATTPDFKSIAQIGDTPSSAIKDTHRALIIWGILLCPNTPQAAHGRWWLSKVGARSTRPEYYWMTCYDTSGTVAAPTQTSYLARGVGHLFARAADGSFISIQAGEYIESHDHKDQGEIQIYAGGAWRFVTANYFSHSGIIQSLAFHNCIQFKQANGKLIEPQWRPQNPPRMQVKDEDNVLNVTVDLKVAFGQAAGIRSYARTLKWDRAAKRLTITDNFEVQDGVTGSWRGTLANEPIQQADGSLKAGPLTIRCKAKSLPPVNWKTESRPKTFDKDCWRIEFTDSNQYQVEFSW